VKSELPEESNLTAEFGTLVLFKLSCRQPTPKNGRRSLKKRQDLLVYLALGQFSSRPKLETWLLLSKKTSKLCLAPTSRLARSLTRFFSLGNPDIIVSRCQNSSVGKSCQILY